VVVAGMEQKQYGAGEGWDGVRGGQDFLNSCGSGQKLQRAQDSKVGPSPGFSSRGAKNQKEGHI